MIRDRSLVVKDLSIQDDGSVITKKGCKIYVPERWLESSLAINADTTSVLGVFAITTDDEHYCVSNVPIMVDLLPDASRTVDIEGTNNLCFDFSPGCTVYKNINMARSSTLPYWMYSELVEKGKVPWYMGYDDMLRLFDACPRYCGLTLGRNTPTLETTIAMIARDPDDITRYYRQSKAIKEGRPCVWVPYVSVAMNTSNPFSALGGGYFEDGISNALTNPSDQVQKLEELLLT